MTEYCGASIENPAESEIEEVVESHSEDEEYYSDARADSLGSENDLESDSGDGESYNPRVHNLTNTLLCVRWAIYSFYGGQSLEDRNTPAYVIDYFMFYVNPYVTDILTPDEYCRSEEYLVKRDYFDELYIREYGEYEDIPDNEKVSRCLAATSFLRERPVFEIIVKYDINAYLENFIAVKYLREYSNRIKLADPQTVPGERKTPAEYCETLESL